MTRPVIIAVAPNGARHQKKDHAGLPVMPAEIANDALACVRQGATMLHLHVRDENGRHSLQPEDYRPALRSVRQSLGDGVLIQVTSEAASVYSPSEQMALMSSLSPDCMSFAIREYFSEPTLKPAVARFLRSRYESGAMIQYIFYGTDDIRHFHSLLEEGLIPGDKHFALFVLGRSRDSAAPKPLEEYVSAFGDGGPWMACAFGAQSFSALRAAITLGGHVRIGFENGWHLPDGTIASDNAALVAAVAKMVGAENLRKASISETQSLLAPAVLA